MKEAHKAWLVVFAITFCLLVCAAAYDTVKANELRARMTAPIPAAALKSDATYVLGTRRVGFTDGAGYNLDDKHAPLVAIISQIAYGDYDHDGWADAALLITEINGPSWLAIVRNVEGTPNVRKVIQLDFPADSIKFDPSGAIQLTESHRYGRKSVAYGYTEPYLWKSIE